MSDKNTALVALIDEVMELYCIPSDERQYLLEGIENGQFPERLDEIFDLYCVQQEERGPLMTAYEDAKAA